jgi:myosin V
MGEIESAGPGKAVLTKTPLKRTPSTSAMKRTASRRAVRGAAGGRRNTIGAKSLGTQFKDNLGSLIKVVNQTHPHYVRCVKPNDDLVPNRVNHERIAEQLRNAGVLEVVRVARAGFPVRLGVSEFVERYGMLAVLTVEEAYRRTVKENERDQEQFVCKELVKAVLRQINGKPLGDDFAAACRENGLQMGLTKVFFQQKAFNKIEKLRTGIVAGAALKIQTFWRAAHWRRAYLIKKGLLKNSDDSRRQKGLAACKIQRCGRAYIARKRARKALASAKLAQEALFQQRLADQAEMYEAQLAKLAAELTAVRAELTKVRIAHDELAAKPARFVVVAAPLGNSAVAEDIAAQMKALLEKGGVQGSQSLVFSS